MSFGEALRQARTSAGLSQAELAEGQYSISYISHLEAGRRSPNAKAIQFLESRLSLTPGSLSNEARDDGARFAVSASVRATSAYQDAMYSWQLGAFGRARDKAEAALDALQGSDRDELAVLTLSLLVEINHDMEHFEDAARRASELMDLARKTADPTVQARAACALSRTARTAGDIETAEKAAQEAVRLTSSDAPSTLRVHALMVAVAAGHERHGDKAVTDVVNELEQILTEPLNPHDVGLACWVLGNHYLRANDIERGVSYHERADSCLSPAANFRSWARFPSAAAAEQLRAGALEGVPALLDEAARRIALLDSPDESATLALYRAHYALARDDTEAALDLLTGALRSEDLPATTRGHLNLLRAKLYRGRGEADAGRDAALQAARAFTESHQSDLALQAWQLAD